MHTIWSERTVPQDFLGRIEELARLAGPGMDTPQEPFSRVAEADAIIAGGGLYYGTEVMDAAPGLRVISRTGIGYDNVDVAEAMRRGIAVCNAPDGPTISTAEHTLMLLLATAKLFCQIDRRMRAGEQRDLVTKHNGLELAEQRLGLVGLGRIGQRVARAAAALQMSLQALDPGVEDATFQQVGVERCTTLKSLLETSDVVSLHIPLTAETRHLIGAEQLAWMKPGALLINAARGGIVDERALHDALVSGHLRGAGLDVFESEPPDPSHPLLQLDNVVATPHIASATEAGKSRLWRIAIEQTLAFLEGRRPEHLVNPEVLQA